MQAEEYLITSPIHRNGVLKMLQEWLDIPKLNIYHKVKVLLLLLKHTDSDEFYLSLRPIWASECVATCKKMLREDNSGEFTNARLVMVDLLYMAKRMRSRVAAEADGDGPDEVGGQVIQQGKLKRPREEEDESEYEARHGFKRIHCGDAKMDEMDEGRNNSIELVSFSKHFRLTVFSLQSPLVFAGNVPKTDS